MQFDMNVNFSSWCEINDVEKDRDNEGIMLQYIQ